MKTMKKILGTLLIVLMCLTAAPLEGFIGLELPDWFSVETKAASDGFLTSGYCGDAADGGDEMDIYWELDDDGVLTITGTGKIAPEAFNYDLRIKEVIIGDGITNISKYCFRGCTNLKKITMGKDTRRINERAFYGCIKLKDIIFSESLASIGTLAFRDCDGLINITLPDSVSVIEEKAFSSCGALTDIKLPDSLEIIESETFYECNSLVNVTFPKALKVIESNAFESCRFFEIAFPDSLETIESHAFDDCYNLADITFNDSLEIIGNYAFRNCPNLASVILPASLKTIGAAAFSGCQKLADITFNDSLETIGNYAFKNCKFTNIVLPDSLTSLNTNAFDSCSSLKSVTIGKGLTNLAQDAFYNCTKLTAVNVVDENDTYSSQSGIVYNKEKTNFYIVPPAISGAITLPASVEDFTYLSLDKCTKITDINVEDGSLYFKSFDGIVYSADGKNLIVCPRGKTGNVTIANGTENISVHAFYNCDGITDITFPASLQTVGSSAFYDCDGISELKFTGELKEIKTAAFTDCSNLEKLTFNDALELIGEQAFGDCLNLIDVTFSRSLKTINKEAFRNCKKLANLTFYDSLKTIGNYAFLDCDALTELILPDSVTQIYDAFYLCSELETVYIGKGLATFSVSGFSECSKLSSITVSEENEALASQDGIVYNKKKTSLYFVPGAISGKITIPATVEDFTINAISGCKNLTDINVEEGSLYLKSFDGVLYSADGQTLLFSPKGKTGIVTIAEGTEIIGSYAFYACSGISDVIFNESLNKIESYAFNSCGALENIEFNDSLKTIGSYAFRHCNNLVNVTFNKSLRTIESYAFYSCSALENIEFNDSLKTIGGYVFSYCENLTNINLPDSLKTIGPNAFSFCSNLKTINIPKLITKIDSSMLSNNSFIELILPENVQTFEYTNWSSLKNLTIENRYCECISPPLVAKDCTVRAYCGSPGHALAVKRLLNFETLGHTFLDWYVVSAPTFVADGIERRDCAYCDGYEERIIPKLQSDIFTATFVANGEVVATVDFPKGATEITEPKVPAKDRYIGEWEDYVLSDADITINAIYTLIKSDDASGIKTSSEAIHYTDKDDVLFRLKAWADAAVVKSTVSKSVPLDIVLVVDQSGSMDETLGGRTKKVDALKETAKDFVNTVLENARKTGADHRISIVGFGLSGNYQEFEKNENTELLTSAKGIVKFDKIKTTDYASSLLSVNVDGEANSKLIAAIDSIEARGATAADLGFEMAKGVFANTDSEDRQRVVIFMTDGEPTYSSGFQTSVANAAIMNANTLKNAYDASIYSVGVFSDADSKNTNIKKFMNAVSSGYPDAMSMSYMGQGVDGQYYLTVNNTDSLTSVFKSISTESLSHTAPFDNLTFIKTLSEYVTVTLKQEEQLRIDLIRQYDITNDDIIVIRNANGTTTVQINRLTPYEVVDAEGNITYEVAVGFFASLNEKASSTGDYVVDTEDSGVMLGADAKGYEATFDTSTITLDSDKTRIIFRINGEVYEISENISDGYAVAPEFNISQDWKFSGWDTKSAKATNGLVLDATLTKADRTVTWHTADGDIVQYYVAGDIIVPPTVSANTTGDVFLSWDRSIPTTMPDENLEFTAVYGGHVHKYSSEITEKMTCEKDGTRTYTCLCGDTYDEEIKAIGHDYEAITPSLEKDDAKCTFVCSNCGDKYDYALDYEVVESTGKKYRVLYEFSLTDDELNTDIQPDGSIKIRIPLSELHGSAEKVTVIRTNDDGSKTQVPAVHEKGYLIITCDHFTPYEVIFDVPCDEHIQGEWIVAKEAACTEEGSRYAECTNCEKIIVEETISKLAHTETDWIIVEASTCTEEGSKHTECSTCGAMVKKETIPVLAHSYTSKVTKEATHLEEGETTYTCECGDSYTEAIEKLEGHTYESVVTAPTCTAEGYTTYTCECGDSYVADYVDMIDHEYTSEITTTATHLTEGAETFSCSCGDSYTKPVTKLENHTYETVVTDSTCTVKGYTTYTCACGDSYTESIDATGHNYGSDGVCENCYDYDEKYDEENEPDDASCSCNCHKSGFMGFIWKILRLFYMIFRINPVCACGIAHY